MVKTIIVTSAFQIADVFFLVYGLILMTFILFQGQYYWKLKWFRLTGKSFDNEKQIKLFKLFELINSVMVALIPFVFGLQFYLFNSLLESKNLLIWAILANIFGMLEHINYYHWQLMIDNRFDIIYLWRNKRFKIASLKKDIISNRI